MLDAPKTAILASLARFKDVERDHLYLAQQMCLQLVLPSRHPVIATVVE